jgi:hypothetical protein
MLDYGECSEAVIFEFKEPIVVIERSGPLQDGIGWNWRGICVSRIAGSL